MNDILPVNTLAGRGIGDNSAAAPLAEVLADELAADKARAAELLASARAARIESAADAGKVADLLVLIREHERSLDAARDARKRPLLHDQRTIDAAFGAVIGSLCRARTDVLTPLLNKWQEAHPDEKPVASIAAVGSRREIQFVIEDLPAAIGWLLLEHVGPLTQAARTILGTVIRASGVDTVERGEVRIPGVSISVDSKVHVR